MEYCSHKQPGIIWRQCSPFEVERVVLGRMLKQTKYLMPRYTDLHCPKNSVGKNLGLGASAVGSQGMQEIRTRMRSLGHSGVCANSKLDVRSVDSLSPHSRTKNNLF